MPQPAGKELTKDYGDLSKKGLIACYKENSLNITVESSFQPHERGFLYPYMHAVS